MPRVNLEELLDELDLLRDICTAVRQIVEGQGIPHSEAQSQALARLRLLDLTELHSLGD